MCSGKTGVEPNMPIFDIYWDNLPHEKKLQWDLYINVNIKAIFVLHIFAFFSNAENKSAFRGNRGRGDASFWLIANAILNAEMLRYNTLFKKKKKYAAWRIYIYVDMCRWLNQFFELEVVYSNISEVCMRKLASNLSPVQNFLNLYEGETKTFLSCIVVIVLDINDILRQHHRVVIECIWF